MKEIIRMSVMNGTIAELDIEGRGLVVMGLAMNKTFDLADDTIVITTSKPRAALSDLHEGDPVEVTYEQHDSGATAHRVDQARAVQHQQAA